MTYSIKYNRNRTGYDEIGCKIGHNSPWIKYNRNRTGYDEIGCNIGHNSPWIHFLILVSVE